ncbi:sugar ABC transporter substrate-binding protein [Rhizohabitans arisaemae]|uniref:sugar ABC transporter substrate-binding protein n=1 Tax=Rhizohabitans arisaemae TaxID=2720610 RepID=UPI0024B14555|nr:sugar ABC transporter substrate-binding protein [Rhizohabitans arisaemae]
MSPSIAKPRRAARFAGLIAFTALLVTACGGVTEDGAPSAGGSAEPCKRSTEKVIGFDYPLTSLSVYGDLKKFAEQRAGERGYQVKYTADDQDLQKQIQNVQTWVTQKIPAIVSYPLEPASMEPLAKQARDNCTVFVSYASPLKNQDAAVLFSGLESGKALGTTAGEWAAKQSKPVKVLVLNNRDLAVGAQRDDGLKETFPGSASNIEIVSTQKAGTRTEGEQITRTVLQAHPDLNMVLGYNDDVALGARQAFLNAGKDAKDPGIFIGGQDGSKEGLQAVSEDGIYRVSVAVRIRDIGFAVTDVAADLLEGKPNTGVNVPPVAVTADHPELKQYMSDYS